MERSEKSLKINDNIYCGKKRIQYLDNIKGILIFLVVFAHFLYQYTEDNAAINYVVQCIYMFHMPAFIFISGYFSKSEHSRSREAILKLVFAYLIFNTATMLVLGWKAGYNATMPYYVNWYLLALIVWKLTVKYVAKIKYVMVWLVLAAVAAGFWKDVTNSFAFSRIVAFYPFFMAGYLCNKEKLNAFRNKPKKAWPIGISAFICITVIYIYIYNKEYITSGSLIMEAYSSSKDILARCLIFVVSALVILGLLSLMPDKRIPFINKCGKNSLAIFLLHRPITLALPFLIKSGSAKLIIPISFVLSVLLCFIFSRNVVFNLLEKILNACVSFVLYGKPQNKKHYAVRILLTALAIVIMFLPAINKFIVKLFDYFV